MLFIIMVSWETNVWTNIQQEQCCPVTWSRRSKIFSEYRFYSQHWLIQVSTSVIKWIIYWGSVALILCIIPHNNTKKSMNNFVHRLFLFVRESVVPLSALLPCGSRTIYSWTRQRDAPGKRNWSPEISYSANYDHRLCPMVSAALAFPSLEYSCR